MNQKQQEYKYFAFISYNSKDTEWGKKLQRKLEHYRMPATLCSEHGWERTPIKPVFFAPTDILPGGLTEELQERLKASRNLIVICSPNSAQSKWVGQEIEYFHNLGRTKNIHFFIVEGEPNSDDPSTECFNPIVKEVGLPEILGANIHEKIYRWAWMNKERAYVQLISKLLGVEFDAIWQRHRRLMAQKCIAWGVAAIIVLTALIGVWAGSQPVDVKLKLNEASAHNDSLPPLKDAVVTMILENETKTDTICSLESSSVFANIPKRFMGKEVQITVTCDDFIDVDTTMVLSEHICVDVFRNPNIYGHVYFTLWDIATEKSIPNAGIIISTGSENYELMSDNNGVVVMDIPLSEQRTAYRVTSSQVKIMDGIKRMPCGDDDVVIVKGE